MRYSISDTAEFGDYTRGKRVIDAHVREQMKGVLADIQSGEFAREWVADMDNGEARLKSMRAEAAQSTLETVGKELRSLMHRAGDR
jgi:ketol-acid reductoisomerase